jgi:nicotinamidase/pyrazinamidase
MTPLKLAAGDGLLIIDVQNDLLPGGALAVPHGDEVLAPLNTYLSLFARHGLPVFATHDWHPADHCSFVERNGPWPRHCVAGSTGARFAPGLDLPADAVLVAKAIEPDTEACSGFAGTELDRVLREIGVRRLFVGGLPTDHCVLDTVRDALRLGHTVLLLRDAVRALNATPGAGDRALAEMVDLGAYVVELSEFAA